ncbi:Peptidyl-prolyl cis-trans isomerase A [Diplonema papillatum]|nr:Peptidyl-prolyl cis-trans isomerase A [Diplonema papillatum]
MEAEVLHQDARRRRSQYCVLGGRLLCGVGGGAQVLPPIQYAYQYMCSIPQRNHSTILKPRKFKRTFFPPQKGEKEEHAMMAKTGLLVCLAGVFCAASAAALDGNRTVLVSCRLRHEKSEDEIDIEVHPTWAPIGAARFLELVRAGFYDDTRIFRAVPDFVAQWGISGDPAVSREWRGKPVKDERKTTKTASNKQHTLAFASSGRNSRNTSYTHALAQTWMHSR